MPKANHEWTVLTHGPIQKLSSRVWRIEGALPGMPLHRVMTVVRTTGGKLLVHNAICLAPAAMSEIEAWGEIGWIVVPNGYHRLDAPPFAARFPSAKVLCPPGAKTKVAEVVRVDGGYADFPSDAAVGLHVLEGVGEQEGYVRIDDEAGVTIVLNDIVFNMPHLPGVPGFVLRHITGSSGGPKISRVARWFVVKDVARVRAELEKIASIEGLARVIVSHHETIEASGGRSAGDVLREVTAKYL